MSKGFIMLEKSYLEDPLYLSERFTRSQAFLDLCFNANYKENFVFVRGNKVVLKQGQLAISLRDLAVRWKWSVNTVKRYICDLQEGGYIDTQKTSVNQVITIKKYIIFNTQIDTQVDTHIDTQTNTQNDTHYITNKDNNNKEEDTIVSKKKAKGFDVRADLSYVEEEYFDTWSEWLDYKDEIKKQYKTQRGAKIQFNILKKLSAGDLEKAKAIVEQSIGHSWDGLFDVKDWQSSQSGSYKVDLSVYDPPMLKYNAERNAFYIDNKFPASALDYPFNDNNRPEGARLWNGGDIWEWNSAEKKWWNVTYKRWES